MTEYTSNIWKNNIENFRITNDRLQQCGDKIDQLCNINSNYNVNEVNYRKKKITQI